MISVNSHVSEFLDYYYNFRESPEYAVLIKGAWGTGKSWYINNTLKKHEESGGKFLYVSLYGVTRVSEIEDSFFQQLHPVLSSKSMTLASKVFKGLLKTTVKIDLDSDGKPDGSISSRVPEISLPEYLCNTENYILVFDDLERCSMSLIDVLGYINHFVEHQGYKVVLIANEDEIISNAVNKDHYPRIKEKLIGKTMEIVPDISSALSHFIDSSDSQEIRNIFHENISYITTLYDNSEYKNLRHLKQALWDFERMYRELPKSALTKDGLVLALLKLHLAFSFEIKSASISASEILTIKDSYWSDLLDKNKDKEKSLCFKLNAKYPGVDFSDTIIDSSIWFDILDKGEISQSKILASLTNSKYYEDENTEDWVKLWHFRDLNDNDFDELLAVVKNELSVKKFVDLNTIKHICGIYLSLSDLGLVPESKKELLSLFLSYIDHLKESGMINPDPRKYLNTLDPESWGGLAFAGTDIPEFLEFSKYMEDKMEESRVERFPGLASELLETLNQDSQLFLFKLIHNNSEHNIYYDIPILPHIPPELFVDRVMALSPHNLRMVSYVFSQRYKVREFNKYIREELPWLSQVKDILMEKSSELKGKVSGHRIERLVTGHLNPGMESLSENH